MFSLELQGDLVWMQRKQLHLRTHHMDAKQHGLQAVELCALPDKRFLANLTKFASVADVQVSSLLEFLQRYIIRSRL
jgi:hypothetical protein